MKKCLLVLVACSLIGFNCYGFSFKKAVRQAAHELPDTSSSRHKKKPAPQPAIKVSPTLTINNMRDKQVMLTVTTDKGKSVNSFVRPGNSETLHPDGNVVSVKWEIGKLHGTTAGSEISGNTLTFKDCVTVN